MIHEVFTLKEGLKRHFDILIIPKSHEAYNFPWICSSCNSNQLYHVSHQTNEICDCDRFQSCYFQIYNMSTRSNVSYITIKKWSYVGSSMYSFVMFLNSPLGMLFYNTSQNMLCMSCLLRLPISPSKTICPSKILKLLIVIVTTIYSCWVN